MRPSVGAIRPERVTLRVAARVQTMSGLGAV